MKVKIGPYPKHRWYHNFLYAKFGYTAKQAIRVDIDKWDTWSMDHTLASIILPMLKQLKASNIGYPANLTVEEWDDIQDQMIFAFELKLGFNAPVNTNIDRLSQYAYSEVDNWNTEAHQLHKKRMATGFRLFGEYYSDLWD